MTEPILLRDPLPVQPDVVVVAIAFVGLFALCLGVVTLVVWWFFGRASRRRTWWEL